MSAIDLDAELRARIDAARFADEVRDEARALLRGMLEEALAPLHYTVRDLERRFEELERRPPPAAPAVRSPRSAPDMAPAPAAVPAVRAPTEPFVSAAAAPRFVGSVTAPPRSPSIDLEVPFDGTRRRRKVALLFALFVVLFFGGLLAAMIWSQMQPR